MFIIIPTRWVAAAAGTLWVPLLIYPILFVGVVVLAVLLTLIGFLWPLLIPLAVLVAAHQILQQRAARRAVLTSLHEARGCAAAARKFEEETEDAARVVGIDLAKATHRHTVAKTASRSAQSAALAAQRAADRTQEEARRWWSKEAAVAVEESKRAAREAQAAAARAQGSAYGVALTLFFIRIAGRGASLTHWITEPIRSVYTALRSAASNGRRKSADFADAAMGTLALVVTADGVITDNETQNFESFILSTSALEPLEAECLRTVFASHRDKLASDPSAGRADVLRAVAKLRSRKTDALAVLEAGILLAKADGTCSPAEEGVIQDLCQTLGFTIEEIDEHATTPIGIGEGAAD